MAKIERYNGNVAAFASQADTNKRTTFGTTDTGDDTLDGNLTADYFTGWQIVGPNDSPTLEDFNAAMFTAGQFLSYLHQAGVPEWNGVQQYQIGSYVNRSGVLYVCKTADHVSVTAPESDGINWGGLDESFVALTGAQSIDGVKTFTESPIVPAATAGFQAATYDQTVGKMLGVGQTWQDVTGSRSLGVTYTNSAGKPIIANLAGSSGSASGSFSVSVNSGTPFIFAQTSSANGPSSLAGNVVIPAGAAYNITGVQASVNSWMELR